MNNLKYAVHIVAVCLFALSSCKKSDSPYYDYVNNIQYFDGSALTYLKTQSAGTFDSLLVVLNRYPDLLDSLQNQRITLFAPVNENFEAAIKYLNVNRNVKGKKALFLKNMNEDVLKELICKYIIRGDRNIESYADERDGVMLKSIIYDYPMHVKAVKKSSSGFVSGGANVIQFSNPFNSVFIQDWITTTTNTVNIKTTNATINTLNTIHNFGFVELAERLND